MRCLSLVRAAPGLALCLCLACTPPQAPPPDAGEALVIRIYEGDKLVETISRVEYLQRLARLRVQREDGLTAAPLSKTMAEEVLNEMIDERLLLREADRLGVRASTVTAAIELAGARARMSDREFERRLAESYQDLPELEQLVARQLSQLQVWEQLIPKIQVTEAELNEALAALSNAQRTSPERVHARQILVDNKRKARKILRLLRRGKDFAELAKKHSRSPEAEKGGDLGWFTKADLPRPFSERCFELKAGERSKLVTSGFGFHIFEVIERQKERSYTEAELKARLKDRLLEDKLRAAKASLRQELRDRVRIKEDAVNLTKIETRL